MGRGIREAKNIKDFSNYSIPELMKVSTDELKELSFEEFGNELSGKKINICSISENGDIVLNAMNADVLVRTNQKTISIFEYDSHICIKLSDKIMGEFRLSL